ncbi:MAG: bifunctional phosphopantothenoylcysteine decarboxylase/phosphopantothenate--cysteine ligase CoaBC [Saccharofermentanales bacterium]
MNRKILLCITGSIAAYKSADIASRLTGKGYDVHVVMTDNATKFISPMVFETLTKNRVYVDSFKDGDHTHVTHISFSTECDLILVAPATYNIIGKSACGIADDLLSSILAATACNKVIYAPAMNINMLNNPALKNNIGILSKRGSIFIEPEEGMLACGVSGKGRLRNIPSILEVVDGFFCEKILKDKKVMITAGATREYIDPIRFISNSSSGLMGVSLAKACRDMGASVTLILANSELEAEGMDIIRISTVKEMYETILNEYEDIDIVFAAAAVSDYTPSAYSELKIKKNTDNLNIEFKRNTDILYELGKLKKNQVLIGFAAESDNIVENARGKLLKKNLDMIIANDLSNFSAKDGKVSLITTDKIIELERKPKEILAYEIVRMALGNLHG